jgi:hypothetical protein
MERRQYSLDDLERMRRAIRLKLDGIPAGCGFEIEQIAKRTQSSIVEQELRTAIFAGIAPEEFES